jgi:hypothetical protein
MKIEFEAPDDLYIHLIMSRTAKGALYFRAYAQDAALNLRGARGDFYTHTTAQSAVDSAVAHLRESQAAIASYRPKDPLGLAGITLDLSVLNLGD